MVEAAADAKDKAAAAVTGATPSQAVKALVSGWEGSRDGDAGWEMGGQGSEG